MCADVRERAQEQFLVCAEEETPVQSREDEHLLLPAAIGFNFLTVIRNSIGRLELFELIFALEKLRERHFLVANRRHEEQVELSDVINGNSRGAVSRRTNRIEAKRQSGGAIEFFPPGVQFHRE